MSASCTGGSSSSGLIAVAVTTAVARPCASAGTGTGTEETLGLAPGTVHRLAAAASACLWAIFLAMSIWGVMRWWGGGIFGGTAAFTSCSRTAGWSDGGGGAWGRGTGTPKEGANFGAATASVPGSTSAAKSRAVKSA